MTDFDELMEAQPEGVKKAIDAICEEAGTSDADWEVLLAAGIAIDKLEKDAATATWVHPEWGQTTLPPSTWAGIKSRKESRKTRGKQ